MRSIKVLAPVTLLAFGLFTSINAVAGGDCLYGHSAKIAQSEAKLPLISADIKDVDPNLLVMLKKQKAKEKQAGALIYN